MKFGVPLAWGASRPRWSLSQEGRTAQQKVNDGEGKAYWNGRIISIFSFLNTGF